MKIVTLEGRDLERLVSELWGAHSVRFAIEDGGLKYSVDQDMWTLPVGTMPDPVSR